MGLVLSLFPGIGLLDMAFEQEGYCVVRGPDVLWGGDVRRFHPSAGKFNGVIGGPPCQSFSSLVHLVRANGHEPRFGNLIPEFERCVCESECDWFLMENVPQAPEPDVRGYGIRSFLLDNSMLDGGDGHGLEQRRVRRFSFGMRGKRLCTCGYCQGCYDATMAGVFEQRKGVIIPPENVPLLTRWIDLAVFVLPDAERKATSCQVDNSQEAKGRRPAMFGDGRPTRQEHRHPAVCSKLDPVPVKIGGSGKVKRTVRQGIAAVGHGEPPGVRDARARKGSVTGSDGGPSVRMSRYRLADALRLQGLPEDFLRDAPFTAEGKLKAVANGVSIPTGRAIAKAIRCALEDVR